MITQNYKKSPLVGSLCLAFVMRNWSILIGYFHSYHVRTKERNILPLRGRESTKCRGRSKRAVMAGSGKLANFRPASYGRFRLEWVKDGGNYMNIVQCTCDWTVQFIVFGLIFCVLMLLHLGSTRSQRRSRDHWTTCKDSVYKC